MASSSRVPSPLGIGEQPPTVHARTAISAANDYDSSAPDTPTLPERPAPGFMIRIPASARASAVSSRNLDRDDSPASVSTPASGGKRRRRVEPIGDTIAATRPRRGRPSTGSPYIDGTGPTGTPSRDVSSAASSRANSSAPPNALSIFQDPAASDVSAEVQTIVGPGAGQGSREARLLAEAASRPTRGGENHVRSGVSASGRGRRVGARLGAAVKTTARKGKKQDAPDIVNQDFCSACRGIGRFLCCDGCPRSFHFMCLEPPYRIDELPESETWYCNKCAAERNPAPPQDQPAGVKFTDRTLGTVFSHLVKRLETSNPEQFRLPQEIRQFFSGVSAGPLGDYVDTETARTKLDRKGFQEERDPLRLRDSKHRHVACYKCGGTSVPTRQLASDPGAQWRPIVSCDYCNLHWHLDCLTPPLAAMPSASRKWMCPNHSDQVMPRRRTVRVGLETVDVEAPGEENNGFVSIIEEPEVQPDLRTDDMVINNKKYRVPERIIQLDFWNKLRKHSGSEPPARTAARQANAQMVRAQASPDDLWAAQLLASMGQVEDDDGDTDMVDGEVSPQDVSPHLERQKEEGVSPKRKEKAVNGARTPVAQAARRPHAAVGVNGSAAHSRSGSPAPPQRPTSGSSDAPRRITLRIGALPQ
ncbi:hypothetical protein CC85DRAFT_262422 [Cutaneotrichosporon oleaginosum]|uniref:PHD-type domain-containing protein n=1 Tax=Cutaneotrichosporon oleaginosum TaxID=879819 RepID=A0A0J0XJB2_9TREE|nr:uncharacterized protein CC85DRAFT_262422 [Cutaneotrichosporon oleaginosum]KLT41146.1 hypothetical protein CC85DRAFT_262422 [Cutaneotrichosporon oleaginosum]TXT14136.1 hypothetical protein COLE_00329 [Cutaneotrichosporon oleaginosum]